MKLVFTIKVFNEESNKRYTFEKKYESMCIPRIGEKIKDPLFEKDRKVIDVIYDFSRDVVYVILIDKIVSDNHLIEHFQEITQLHNWIVKKKWNALYIEKNKSNYRRTVISKSIICKQL